MTLLLPRGLEHLHPPKQLTQSLVIYYTWLVHYTFHIDIILNIRTPEVVGEKKERW